MKTIHDWFDEYGQSHQNKTNKIIHWICIPLIFWSIIALLSLIPQQFIKIGSEYNFLHFGTIVIILGLFFYLRLSFKIFLGMFVFSLYVLLDVYFWDTVFGRDVLMYLAISIFVFSWILQFYGHKIEGKNPHLQKTFNFY